MSFSCFSRSVKKQRQQTEKTPFGVFNARRTMAENLYFSKNREQLEFLQRIKRSFFNWRGMHYHHCLCKKHCQNRFARVSFFIVMNDGDGVWVHEGGLCVCEDVVRDKLQDTWNELHESFSFFLIQFTFSLILLIDGWDGEKEGANYEPGWGTGYCNAEQWENVSWDLWDTSHCNQHVFPDR